MSSPGAKSPYDGHHFPAEVISQAVWLYFRFPLSLRMVEEMLGARGIVVPTALPDMPSARPVALAVAPPLVPASRPRHMAGSDETCPAGHLPGCSGSLRDH